MKIFRKIRIESLDKNQAWRYLKYAVGEILLVVIGILIALQVNTWNEEQKRGKKEQLYLRALKQDFIKSQNELDRILKKTSRVSRTTDTLLSLIRSNAIPGNEALDSLLGASAGFTIFMPTEGVIQDLSSSGQLDLIQNDTLRSKIASWTSDLRMIREYETLYRSAVLEYMRQLNRYTDLSNLRDSRPTIVEDLLDDLYASRDIRNLLGEIYMMSRNINMDYRDKKSEIDTLIQIIDNEIEKHL